MIPLYPQQIPSPLSQPNSGGVFAQAWWWLINALYNRTGGASGNPFTVGAGLTATAGAVGPLPLTNDYNEVLAGGGLGVMLYNMQPGQSQVVFNGTGSAISVFPFTTGSIDALAVNAVYALANGKSQWFRCVKLLASGGRYYRSFQQG